MINFIFPILGFVHIIVISSTHLLLRTVDMMVMVRGTRYKMKLDRTEVTVATASSVWWSLIFAAIKVTLQNVLIAYNMRTLYTLPYNKVETRR